VFVKKGSITLAMLVASVLINVTLAHKLRHFNDLVGPLPDHLLKSGTLAPSFEAVDLRGQAQLITYDKQGSRSTVLYVFTPPCPWCARNMDNIEALADKAGTQYRFVALSLSAEGLADYVSTNEFKLAVYSGLSPETVKTYKLGSTPQTIVISPEGKVLQNWIGAYTGDQKSQVEAFFHVTLPGLKDLPKAGAAKK
jgi:peroxiredoxin